ncbi:hypothetical protein BG006_008559 [Podila minutissima]|uniref:DOC domain-containing protein n=1 Tax=Podila minutissima TaxID=64525 RepID=A0A9P5SJH9_9FUNG|nr:hypothetical protein BG006_008559 [Podila minutissima]
MPDPCRIHLLRVLKGVSEPMDGEDAMVDFDGWIDGCPALMDFERDGVWDTYQNQTARSHIQLSFYNDSKLDESYTPQRISVRGGTDFHDLKELVMLELEDLSGWTNIKLEDSPGSGKAPQVFLLQFAVLLNQQSGKDTHIRQLKIFSTKEPALIQDEQIPFEDPKFMQFANIR